jgi:hypothetical protein
MYASRYRLCVHLGHHRDCTLDKTYSSRYRLCAHLGPLRYDPLASGSIPIARLEQVRCRRRPPLPPLDITLSAPWTLGYRPNRNLDTLPEQILDEITDKYPAQLGYNEISGAGGRGPSCHYASPHAALPLNLVAMITAWWVAAGGSRG